MADIKGYMPKSSGDEWSTPQDLFDRFDDIWRFNLDVCATPENAKCGCFIRPEDDALLNPWSSIDGSGRCWMNPPHSKLKAFCKRALEQVQSGDALFVVGLLPARTDTVAFHEYIYGKAQIQFLRGRLKFGGAKNSAPFPSMIVVWGSEFKAA